MGTLTMCRVHNCNVSGVCARHEDSGTLPNLHPYPQRWRTYSGPDHGGAPNTCEGWIRANAPSFDEEFDLRKADKHNRQNVHVEIIDELLSIPGMNAELAGRLVESLDAGKIPHCSITY